MSRLLYIYLIVLCLLNSGYVFADTFIVTTITNAGPGSLRDAIEQANNNGDRVPDFIYFNIPAGVRDKTIFIRPFDLLPALTSNITIDGTTQPGSALGASTAKITIAMEGTPPPGSNALICFNLSRASNIAVYGLFIKANVADRNTLQRPELLYGIYMQDSHNIIIGETGKGNVLSGWSKAVFNDFDARFGYSGAIRIQSNFFGLDSDGISIDYSGRSAGKATNTSSIYIEEARGVLVGGTTDRESNFFNSTLIDVFIQGEYNAGIDGTVRVINNKLGIGVDGTNLNSSTFTGIRLTHLSNWLSGFPPILIARNYIGGSTRAIGIQVDSILPRFRIEENILGFEENSQPPGNSNYGIGIVVNECENGMIGGNNPALANTIRYWKNGAITCDSTRDISIFQNSTYCNSKRAIKLLHWYDWNSRTRVQPFVTINSISNLFGIVSGTANPLSTIELFYDDDCPGCEGKSFTARTTSNAAGNWVYRGPVGRGNIIATASDRGNATSEYSTPQIDTANMISSAIICKGGKASICGLSIISGTTWQWEDASGTVIGTDTCLTGISVGTYRLRIAIGSQSCEEVFNFQVRDSTLDIDSSQRLTITNTRCGKNNGAIRGIKAVNADRWQWEDANGNIVGTDMELTNAVAGTYRFRVFNRSCNIVSGSYIITDITPAIDESAVSITATTCNGNNGSIQGLLVSGTDYSAITWIDQSRKIAGRAKDLINSSSGQYKLIVADTAAGCADSTNLFTIPATPGPVLITSGVTITHTTCNATDGAITNIVTTGTTAPVVYVWVDEQNKIVGNSLSLTNSKAGRYRLKMKDASSCDTVISPQFEILNNGSIEMDTSGVTIQPTGCTKINGSITGIKITGAGSIQWINAATNRVVSTNADLINMPAGNYRLTVANTLYGCIKQTRQYTIGTAAPQNVTVTQSSVTNANCNTNNGSIEITQFDKDIASFTFSWLQDSTINIGSNTRIVNLSPSIYYLIATDSNGCSKSIYKQAITMLPMPVISENNVMVTNDTCSFYTGSITGINASSTLGNLTYQWFNSSNTLVGSTKTIDRLSSGNYQLTVTDITGCQVKTAVYTVNQIVTALPTPRYDALSIPRYSAASLRIKNPVAGAKYELFDAAGQLLQNNNSGNFELASVREDMNLLVKISGGSCNSEFGQAVIKVIDLTQLDVPNAFSPNGDGINDVFRIRITGYFKPDALKIYNRWGQIVFETKDLGNEWNGTIKGKPLPIGTYYWVIEGLNVYGKLFRSAGSVTLLR